MSIPAEVPGRSGRETSIARVLSACRRALYEREVHDLCEADCTVGLPGFDPVMPVEIRTAALADLPRLAEVAPPHKLSQFRERLARGEICSMALSAGRVASYVWITPHDHFDPWFRTTIPTGRDSCVGYDAYTDPDFRRLGVRKLMHLDERRRVVASGRRRLIFWLERGVSDRAMLSWQALGLRQRLVGTIISRRFFRRIVFTTIRRYSDP
ncbi:MAG: hypothetical protein R3344_03600 [Acidobacteriota bacterium]|nr:hypothetical protein [Acidobacteriota bacterium]